MRLASIFLAVVALAFASITAAQDPSMAPEAGTTQEAPPSPTVPNPVAGGNGASPVDDNPTRQTGLWNSTQFITPTRNNYWVNGATNFAKWTAVNMPVNLVLANSNSTLLDHQVVLAQNLPAGATSYSTTIDGYNVGNNYLLILTMAGNPSQKVAQSQGFRIMATGTANLQQIPGEGTVSAATGAVAGGPSGNAINTPNGPSAAVPGAEAGASPTPVHSGAEKTARMGWPSWFAGLAIGPIGAVVALI